MLLDFYFILIYLLFYATFIKKVIMFAALRDSDNQALGDF